jgi:hypothetical protein
MSITNVSKPSTSLVNTTRPQQGETWNTNSNTWDGETRTWDASGTLWTNGTKPTTLITNTNKPS